MKFESKKIFSYILCCITLIGISSRAFAQVRSATLSGTVQDPSGRVVGGATVTATEVATNQVSVVKSNDTGNFSIPYLPAGSYSVTVALAGFQTTSQAGIAVGNGEDIHLSIALKVGTQNEVVQVNTEATGIQVDSPVVQTVIGEQVVAAIPNVAHNPLAYVGLEAGINTRGAQASQTNTNSFGIGIFGRRQISDFAINGGQAFENDVQLDGLSTQSPGFNEVTVVINQDAIQEVRALVNNYSAQYGRAHGIIAETSKGGTDKFHGLAFMRNRSSALAANSYFNNNQGIAKLPTEVWTYGGTVGGPIIKSKAFFFGSFEGLYFDNPRTFLRTIPTALERVGDFSKSYANVNGTPTLLNLYDPFNVTQTGNNVYQRAKIAGANTNNSLNGTNQFALNVLSNYPCPTVAGLPGCTNRQADDAYNTNNFQSTGLQQFRKSNFNGRVDYHLSDKNFLYFSGGYTRSNITNPLIWDGKNLWNPYVSLGDERFDSDRNPYVTIGDTQILSPTLVLDLHYGVSRVDTTFNSDLVPKGFDYSSLGISAIDQANSAINVVPSFSVTGGNWTPPNNNNYVNKHERQLHHVVSGSITKSAGKWNYKAGGEFRAYLANYIDAQTSAVYTLNSSFTLPTVNSSGGQVGTVTANNGGNPWASFLLGAGSVGIPQTNAIHPAFLHQYAAIYTQNDWRPTEKLTLNIGLRWDWQPGVEERYNRFSSVDLRSTNPFGGKGSIYFPGANGNGRRLWDTDWSNFQPRLGFAYRPGLNTVVRGGAGVTFLPSNTGFFDGPGNFGTSPFANYTNSQPYGFGVQTGVPVGTFDSAAVNQFVVAPGSNLNAPANYGSGYGAARFLAHDYKNSYVYQGNLHVQQALAQGWSVDIGYNVEVGKRLPTGSGYTPNSDQLLSDATLQSFRADYIARNGKGSIGSDQVANPFQPNPNNLLPFGGNLAKATLPYDQTLWAYPALGSFVAFYNHGFSTYHALQASLHKDFSHGLLVGTNFTWSKSLGVDGGLAQNNFASEGSYNSFPNLRSVRQDKRLSPNDTPIRFASYGVYDLPFGQGKAFSPGNSFVRGLVSGYRLGGTYIWQSGVPQQVSYTGSLNGLPDRNPGVPFELPKSFQHFYDGKTSIVLPVSGRTITPCAKCFLKYNPDAFKGRTVQVANGTLQADTYFFGNSSTNYGGLRTDPVDNITMSLSRNFKFRERYIMEFQGNVTNLLNHTQFAPGNFNGTVGSVQIPGATAQSQLQAGYGNGTQYGTHTNSALDPRLIELQARFSF